MFIKKFNVLSFLGALCAITSTQPSNLSAEKSYLNLFEDDSPYKIHAAAKADHPLSSVEMPPAFKELGRGMKTLKKAAQAGSTLGKYYWAECLKEQGKVSQARTIFEDLAAEKHFIPALVRMDEIDSPLVKKKPTPKSPFLAVFESWSHYMKKIPGFKTLTNLAQRFGL